jgi:hypothetical protein
VFHFSSAKTSAAAGCIYHTPVVILIIYAIKLFVASRQCKHFMLLQLVQKAAGMGDMTQIGSLHNVEAA